MSGLSEDVYAPFTSFPVLGMGISAKFASERLPTLTKRLVQSDGALIGVMAQRCVNRGCEGGDENKAQAASSECCSQFYGDGADLVRWCDMCLMAAAINALQEHL